MVFRAVNKAIMIFLITFSFYGVKWVWNELWNALKTIWRTESEFHAYFC